MQNSDRSSRNVSTRFGGGVEHHRSGESRLSVWVPAPGIFYSRIVGTALVEFVEPVVRGCERASRSGRKTSFFNDWLDLERYESVARLELTGWALRNRDRVERSHVLVRSKMVAMGVQVANLTLGSMFVTYDERTAFEAELDRTLAPRGLRLSDRTELRTDRDPAP